MKRNYRPTFEILEDRVVPVVDTWTGAQSNLWSVADNWQGRVPQAGDDVVFDNANASLTSEQNIANLDVASFAITTAYPGTITLTRALTVDARFAQANGTINGAGNLILSGTTAGALPSLWSGGTIGGSGNFEVGAGVVLIWAVEVPATTPRTLDGRTLVIDGAGNGNGSGLVRWNGGDQVMTNAAQVNDGGTFQIDTSANLSMVSGGGATSVFRVSAGGQYLQGLDGSTVSFSVPFDNFQGKVSVGSTVDPSHLNLLAGGTATGVAPTNNINTALGGFTRGGPVFTAEGLAIIDFAAAAGLSYNVAGFAAFNGTGAIQVSGNVSVLGGALASITPYVFNFDSGTINNQGQIAIGATDFFWIGGANAAGATEFTGSGTVMTNSEVTVGGGVVGPSSVGVRGGTFTTLNSFDMRGNMFIDGGATFNNVGTFDIHDGATISAVQGQGLIMNYGLFRKASGGGTAQVLVPFVNFFGAVFQQSGTLVFGTFTQVGGLAQIQAGTMETLSDLVQEAGSVEVFANATLDVTGTYAFSGDTTTVDTSGTLIASTFNATGGSASIAGTMDVTTLMQENGVINVLATASVTTGAAFSELENGSETLAISLASTNALINSAGPITVGGNLVLDVAAGFNPGGSLITLIHNTGSTAVENQFNTLANGAYVTTIGGDSYYVFYNPAPDDFDVVLATSDPDGGSSTSPVANDYDVYPEGSPTTVAVLADDYDQDGDPLTVTAVGTPSAGTAVINAGTTITYTPTSGTTATTDSFSYTISDGHGGTLTATLYVFLTDPASVANDGTVANVTAAVTVDILPNDYDPAGNSLTITAVGTPAYGTAVINGGTSITYTPTNPGTASTDAFTYTISDGHGGTSSATITILNGDVAPVAADFSVGNVTAGVTLAVLNSDYEAYGDALTVTAVGTPGHGTAVINSGTTVTYTPTVGTTATTDAFTYTISDGHGGTSTATVYLYLYDRPPVAVDDTAIAHSAAVTIDVLAADSDPDNNPLTVTAVGTPSHGTAVINSGTTVTYTPTSGTTFATDSFTYTISDGEGGTSTGTVVVYLADPPPIAVDEQASTHSAPVTIAVLANDSSPDGNQLTVTAVGTPAHGTAVINSGTTVTYTPTSGTTFATDSFTYTISDGYGGTSTGTVVVYLADRPPVAVDDQASAHSAAVTIPVLANDSDPDGDQLTVTAVGSPAHGTAVINSGTTVTYTPTSGTTFTTDSFTYTISDGYGGTSTATVTFTSLIGRRWRTTQAPTPTAPP